MEFKDILEDRNLLYPFMQFLKAEGAVNLLQFKLTIGTLNYIPYCEHRTNDSIENKIVGIYA